MSIAAGSLTINAAFLQEIKEDNRELRHMLVEIEQMFQRAEHPPAEWHVPARKASELLAALRDQLAIHFSLEESFGYFENAVDAAPRLSIQATTLRNEHQTLFKSACAMVERAERMLYGEPSAGQAPRLVEAWRCFHRDLERHEERERELILHALDDDLGGGD